MLGSRRSHLSKFITQSVQFTKIVETRRDTGAEIPSGRVKFDPQSSDKNVFVTPPPSFILSLSLFFPSTSPSFFSLSSSSSSSFALFCPFRIPLPLSSRPNKMGQNTKRTKPQIYNFAMRIIIEYQKLCYSLFHSAHLLPQRAVFPRRGNKSSR